MKILVIGSGGREHALVWKLAQSRRVQQLYCAPGNAGICGERSLSGAGVECLPVKDGSGIDDYLRIATTLRPDLTVVGPEAPLSLGLVDELARRGLRAFGPTQAASQLEWSKSFAKHFMQLHGIPTAHYSVCTSQAEIDEALPHFSSPIVVKADGLAAGKGVLIAQDREEAGQVAAQMLAGGRVVLEEFLEGEELSFLVLSDGERAVPLPVAQDHKRIGDGDTGPNTGGMGAYSTDQLLEPSMSEWLMNHVVKPVLAGMRDEGTEYKGVLYCGLMMTARGPMVLEFNCRFGDPETQAILMRLSDDCDLAAALESCVEGSLHDSMVAVSPEPAACVVMASAGYPGAVRTGDAIMGLTAADDVPGVKVFHAATTKSDGGYETSGGRVLGVTARGADLRAAVDRAYQAVAKIRFDGMQFRRDIAARALKP